MSLDSFGSHSSSIATLTTIDYIRREIPEFEIPAYRGERYEALVPDTLDLAERAELAVNGVTGPADPNADYEIYFSVNFFRDPPVMAHNYSDICVTKFMEALPLLRLITGSSLNSQVDRAWMESLLHMIGPDGLVYLPKKGTYYFGNRTWTVKDDYSGSYLNPVWRADGKTTKPSDESVTQLAHNTHMLGRLIGAMTIYYLRDKNPMWKENIERMIQRLRELAIDKGTYCYFPLGTFEPNAKVNTDAEMPKGDWAGINAVWTIQGLVQYYRVNRFVPALELAGKLIEFLKDHGEYYGADSSFLPGLGCEKIGAHHHIHDLGLLAILEYAELTEDRGLMEFVRKGYEYGKAHGSSLVGFFPERISPSYPFPRDFTQHLTSETCEVADMIALALKLTEADVGDYWDDVDRWVRNQFAENQLTRIDWIERIHRPQRRNDVAPTSTSNRVAERNLGAFAGWPTANDWTDRQGIMHCCTGNAVRTIYYVWENILHYKDGALRINLLLNRASPWADVESHIPYVGKVDVKIKQPCKNVMIRVPEWIKTENEVSCTVNGKPNMLKWNGRYVDAGSAEPDDLVTVTFPIWERTVKEFIGDKLYTIVIRGNDVVFIDPPGKYCPLYQRAHYRENKTRWIKRERFVSNEHIEW